MRSKLSSIADWAFDHPVLAVLLLALVVRLAVAVVIAAVIGTDAIAPDALELVKLATERAAGDTAGWTPTDHQRYDDFATYLIPLTGLFRIFGPRPFLGQLLSVLGGAGAAAATCALLLRVTARRWALLGGAVVALLPSQIVFSSVGIRDGPVWALTATIALVVTIASSATGRRLALLGLALVGLLFLIGHLRHQSVVVASYAVALASVVSASRDRLWRVGGAVLIAVVVPWTVGIGPAGVDFVTNRDLSEIRALNAAYADSGFIDEEAEQAALAGERKGRGIADDLEHLPRGLSVMVVEPLPWSRSRSGVVRLAKLEMVVWYPLLVLAFLGLGAAWRQRRSLAFPVLYGAGMITLYAFSEGNLGSAYRHRGEAGWAIACLAALGFAEVWGRRHRQLAAVAAEDLAGGVPTADVAGSRS